MNGGRVLTEQGTVEGNGGGGVSCSVQMECVCEALAKRGWHGGWRGRRELDQDEDQPVSSTHVDLKCFN